MQLENVPSQQLNSLAGALLGGKKQSQREDIATPKLHAANNKEDKY
jgi:hypothetical protein